MIMNRGPRVEQPASRLRFPLWDGRRSSGIRRALVEVLLLDCGLQHAVDCIDDWFWSTLGAVFAVGSPVAPGPGRITAPPAATPK